MARELDEGSYYVSYGGKIPVNWRAPEVCIWNVSRTHTHTHTSVSGSPLQEVFDSQWCVEFWVCHVWDMESWTQAFWGLHKPPGLSLSFLALLPEFSCVCVCVGCEACDWGLQVSPTPWLPSRNFLPHDELLVWTSDTHSQWPHAYTSPSPSPCVSFSLSLSLSLPPFLSLSIRHPDKSLRPSFSSLHHSLTDEPVSLLHWGSEEKTAAHTLGAPLEAGRELHHDLQETYLQKHWLSTTMTSFLYVSVFCIS